MEPLTLNILAFVQPSPGAASVSEDLDSRGACGHLKPLQENVWSVWFIYCLYIYIHTIQPKLDINIHIERERENDV